MYEILETMVKSVSSIDTSFEANRNILKSILFAAADEIKKENTSENECSSIRAICDAVCYKNFYRAADIHDLICSFKKEFPYTCYKPVVLESLFMFNEMFFKLRKRHERLKLRIMSAKESIGKAYGLDFVKYLEGFDDQLAELESEEIFLAWLCKEFLETVFPSLTSVMNDQNSHEENVNQQV